MQKFIEKLWRNLRYLYSLGNQKIKPIIQWVHKQLGKLDNFLYARPRTKKWIVRTSLACGPPISFMLLLSIVIWWETPGKRALRNIKNHVASEVYSADSVLLGRYYIQDRTEVAHEEIASVVFDALIATEDVRFYEHRGIDYISFGRVLVKSVFMQDESAGGGSTITQQLAKNLYPRKRYWILSMLINKMREIIVARRLEKVYAKEELLTLYLNTVPFGDNVFGIEAAALRFYSTTAKKLTLNQAAVLIGMLKATHSYNPRLFPERSLERRNVVLTQMAKYDFLSEKKADSIQALPIKLKYKLISHHQGLAPYFRVYLKGELLEWCKKNRKPDGSPYNLYTDGLKIYTTIDSKLQRYAENGVRQQMTEIQKQFFMHWGKERPWKGKEGLVQEAIHRSSRYQQLKEQGLSEEEIIEQLRNPMPMRIFSWKGEQIKKVSPIDSIMHHLQYLNAGFLAMDPSTGEVKAWVGGIDHEFFQYDHVKTTTKRQVGSIFKPIVYAMAIEQGVEPCELISADRETYTDEEGEKWSPRNMQNDYDVEYSMRGALAYSVNTVSVKLIQRAGVEKTISLARKMGITSNIPRVPSIALGSPSVSLMEMTTAYSCIANDGITNQPYYIKSIVDQGGNLLEDRKPESSGERALSKETALMIRHMLQTVVHEGTASRLRWKYGVYNDVAGKTGTTQSNADGWFMAITPKLTIGTWVGADDPRIRFRYTNLGQGSNTALPMAAYFLKQVNKDSDYKSITQAEFSPLPNNLRQKLDCDLYELNDELWQHIAHLIFQRDSIMNADTLAEPPPETFLEMLYKRKMRIQEASQKRDSIELRKVEVLEGG